MDLRGICPWVVENKEENTRYMTHNLTNLLVKGKNAVGLLAGHVMLTDEPIPQILGLVMVQLEGDDKPLFFSTASAGWLQTTSYVVDDSAWATTINWTKREAGWSMPSFMPGPHWVPAKPAAPANATVLPARALQMPVGVEDVLQRRLNARAIQVGGRFPTVCGALAPCFECLPQRHTQVCVVGGTASGPRRG